MLRFRCSSNVDCSPGFRCEGGYCEPGRAEASSDACVSTGVEVCTDQVDNDCNEKVDCEDPSCLSFCQAGDGGGTDASVETDGGTDVDAGSDGGADSGIALVFDECCSVDRWCWQNPLPHGNDLWDVWASNSSDVWVVGEKVSMLHWNGARWSRPAGRANESAYSVWGATPDDVWAYSDRLLHWNGDEWSAWEIDAGTPLSLGALGGSSASDVWAVGYGDSAIHWNGAEWSLEPPDGGVNLDAVWSWSSTDAWAVGTGALVHWNGLTWDRVPPPGGTPGSFYRAVWGSAPTDVWAVGLSGLALHWNGASWGPFPAPVGLYDFSAVWGSSATDVWLAASSGGAVEVLHWDGSLLSPKVPGDKREVLAGFSLPSGEAWAVGRGGAILSLAEGRWSPVFPTETADLYDVWGTGPNDVWAVGEEDLSLHWDGLRWEARTNPLATRKLALYGVTGSGPTDVWAVGGTAAIHWDGSAWVSYPLGVDARCVAGGGAHVWALGANGWVARWNGSGWPVEQTPLQGSPRCDLWVESPTDLWAVNGTGAMRWTGTGWAAVDLSDAGVAPTQLVSVWGTSSTDVWLLDAQAQVTRWNGAGWATVATLDAGSAPFVPKALAGMSETAVWAAGRHGRMFRWNGAAWAEESTEAARDFFGLWGQADAGVWGVGTLGAVLHKPLP